MKMHSNHNSIQALVYTSLFTALIAAGAYIAVPIGPVPLVMQNFFVLLAGLVLGPKMGTTAVLTYLVIGTLGIPVFAGGTGGPAHFLGPTGGYLLGYVPAVFITGLIANKSRRKPSPESAEHPLHNHQHDGKQKERVRAHESERETKGFSFPLRESAAAAAGIIIIYAAGVPWLAWRLGFSFPAAVTAGMLPFLPGDVLKAAAAVITARAISARVKGGLFSV